MRGSVWVIVVLLASAAALRAEVRDVYSAGNSIVVSPEGTVIMSPVITEGDSNASEAAQLRADGYIDRSSQTSKLRAYSAYVQTAASKNASGSTSITEFLRDVSSKRSRDTVLRIPDEDIDDSSAANIPFSPVDSRFKQDDNVGYLVIQGGRTAQLHSSTEFGKLLVEEFASQKANAIDAWVVDPNIEVLGVPGKLVHIKYSANEWGTMLFAPHNHKVVMLECDTKLTETASEQFRLLAEDLLRLGS